MKTNRNENIKNLYGLGRHYRELAKQFNISRQRVHQIVTGYRSPAHLPPPITELKLNTIRKMQGIDFSALSMIPLGHIEGGRDKFRERIRMRNNHTCQHCGKVWIPETRRFDVHHLDPAMEGRSGKRGVCKSDKENFDKMITLCHKCHLNIPHIREKMGNSRHKSV